MCEINCYCLYTGENPAVAVKNYLLLLLLLLVWRKRKRFKNQLIHCVFPRRSFSASNPFAHAPISFRSSWSPPATTEQPTTSTTADGRGTNFVFRFSIDDTCSRFRFAIDDILKKQNDTHSVHVRQATRASGAWCRRGYVISRCRTSVYWCNNSGRTERSYNPKQYNIIILAVARSPPGGVSVVFIKSKITARPVNCYFVSFTNAL